MISLRVLLVIDYKLSYLGGAQTALRQQAVALAGAGHRVTVAAPDASSDRELVSEGDITVWDAPFLVTIPVVDLPVIPNNSKTRARVHALLTRQDIDLVIAHSEFGLASATLEVAAARDIPTMHTVHTFFWRGPAVAGFVAPLVTILHRAVTGLAASRPPIALRRLDSALRGMTLAVSEAADLVISPSHHQAAALRAAGLPDVTVISNTSADLDAGPVTAPMDGPLRLVWAARFAPEKRLSIALAAMNIVEAKLGPGAVHLDVAGGVLRHPFACTSVTIHGRVQPQEIMALLRAAHAALITSHGFDNQPMIAVEAFKTGLPVIVSDPTLATEFGAAAILAADTSAVGLARTIIRFAQHRDQLRHHSVAAVQYSANTSQHRHAEQIQAAYNTLAQGTSRRNPFRIIARPSDDLTVAS
jgi:glycosyltransferase involved in cell wall biosynthesis